MAEKEIKVELNKPQAQFLQLPHKFRGFIGGYGSGKTYTGCIAMCQHAWEHPKINQGYFAPTFPHIRDIYYPTIDEVAYNMGLHADIKEGNKEVHFYNGQIYKATAICRSMDNPGSIVGFKIGHGMIDELDVLPFQKAETAWRKIIARLRYKVPGLKNGIDVATTPEGFKFTHKLFVEELLKRPEKNDNYAIIQASTYDNEKNLPDDYISSLIETYPEELIKAYLNGQFVNLTSGTVYNAYDRVACNSVEVIKDKEQLYVGMDFNVTNMSAVISVKRGKAFHAVSELTGVYDTPSMTKILKEMYLDNGHIINVYPDASGNARKTVNASVSDIAILRQAGFYVRVANSNPAVKDRVVSGNRAFEKGLMFVNASLCPKTADCFERLAYDDNGQPDKKSGFDHIPDALTYFIVYEMPVRKPVYNMDITIGR